MSDEETKTPPESEGKPTDTKPEAKPAEAKPAAKAAEAKPAAKAAEAKAAEAKPAAKAAEAKAAEAKPAAKAAAKPAAPAASAPEVPAPTLHVAPSPHVSNRSLTTRSVMVDVLIALVPVVIASVIYFRLHAVKILAITTASAMIFEWLFTKLGDGKSTLGDGTAAITGLILGLSFPWTTPWWICVIAAMIGIGLAKTAFGGLGQNIFNPAMAGRAFAMISFSAYLGANAYVDANAAGAFLSQATPLTAARTGALFPELWPLFVGNTNGSLGETSALAAMLGGLYLIIRRTASWEIPGAMFVVMTVLAGVTQLLVGPNPALATMKLTVLQHLFSGAFTFGAFFIATDPVTSPMTRKGKFWFGAGISFFVWVLRVFSNYPEGLMFAVLLMNALTPLLNRWTVPTPVGGPVPKRA